VPIRVIALDCDGVLLDSVAVKTRAFASIFAAYGPEAVDFVVAHHLANGGVSRYEKFRHFFACRLGRGITAEEMGDLDRRFTEAALAAVCAAPMIPGAREFLEQGRAVWPLYVASGAPEHELLFIFERLGLTRFFRAIYGSPRKKAESLARIVAECRASCGAAPEEVLMVGDSGTDLEAAANVGTRFLGIGGPGSFPPAVPCMPDLTGLKDFALRLA
jgi:HAD superfamily hydrolase (TIGR01549 family)